MVTLAFTYLFPELMQMMGTGQFLIGLAVTVIAFYVLYVVGLWRLFNKADEKGWKALIPFYNTYILFKISWDGNKYLTYLCLSLLTILWELAGIELTSIPLIILGAAVLLIEILVLIITIRFFYKLSKSFGHGAGYAVGLFLFKAVFIMILGYGQSDYLGPQYKIRHEEKKYEND